MSAAAKDPTPKDVGDNRITCTDCRELSQVGRCRVAMRGERKDVSKDYGPADPEQPQRCIFFTPKPGAADSRIGIERYPSMWREYKARYPESTIPASSR